VRIGFIGLGNMGGGMAANLAKAGHDVRAFDLSEAALERAVASGCAAAADARGAVMGADVVVTMLPAAAHVRGVMADAVLPVAAAGTLVIDCSTIDVGSARALEAGAQAAGLAMVDAPVSGGIAAAAAGTLTFMVGGSDEGFARAEPVLAGMGRAVIHAGGPGSGQAAKICNNMLLGASMIATAEAFTLAQALGLETQTFFDIASKASGQCWSMTSYCPVPGPVPAAPSNRGYEGGFASALMLKDLKLAVQAAADAGTPVPMGAQAAAFYQLVEALGAGRLDFSVVARVLAGDLGERGQGRMR
jgi:3-hydroxyisobutyrate dehydrogenase